MITNIFLITGSGEPIFTIKLGSIEASDAMVGGFISAIQSFANQIMGGDIDRLTVGPYHLLMRRTGDNILVVAADDNSRETRVQLDQIQVLIKDLVGNVPCDVIQQLIVEHITKKKSAGDKAELWAKYGL
ncbi:MAG: hypothetical protein ACFFCH_02140 [Promethearchaeota archaeon]